MKKTLTAITLATVMTLGTTFANAGIIVAGKANVPSCNTTQGQKEGIIVAGFVGIIVAGFTGIIVAGATSDTEPCTIETNKEGIIVAG